MSAHFSLCFVPSKGVHCDFIQSPSCTFAFYQHGKYFLGCHLQDSDSGSGWMPVLCWMDDLRFLNQRETMHEFDDFYFEANQQQMCHVADFCK